VPPVVPLVGIEAAVTVEIVGIIPRSEEIAAVEVAAVAPAVPVVTIVAVAVVGDALVDERCTAAVDGDAGGGREPAVAPMLGLGRGGNTCGKRRRG